MLRKNTSEVDEFVSQYSFTDREKEVFLSLINKRTSPEEIGEALSISPNTAANHLKRIFLRSGAKSKTELLAKFVSFCLEKYNSWDESRFGRPFTILIAEDDPDDQMMAKRAMNQIDVPAELVLTSDGQEALDYLFHKGKFVECHAPRPDMILLDLRMPQRGGDEVLHEIKNNDDLKRIPVVIFSVSSSTTDVQRSYTDGANSYVTKPSSYADLVDTMKTVTRFWLKHSTLPSE